MSNRGRNFAFRDEVLLYLHDQGLTAARRRPEPKRLTLSEQFAAEPGDIIGLPWVLGVRCQQTIDLSTAMTMIANQAEFHDRAYFASIQKRKGHPVDDAYVTMPLHVFVDVLNGRTPGVE